LRDRVVWFFNVMSTLAWLATLTLCICVELDALEAIDTEEATYALIGAATLPQFFLALFDLTRSLIRAATLLKTARRRQTATQGTHATTLGTKPPFDEQLPPLPPLPSRGRRRRRRKRGGEREESAWEDGEQGTALTPSAGLSPWTGLGLELTRWEAVPNSPLDLPETFLTVSNMVEGGPAQTSGKVCIGDVLIRVDTKRCIGKDLPSVTSLLSGPAGTFATLHLVREGDDDKAETVVAVLERRPVGPTATPKHKGLQRGERLSGQLGYIDNGAREKVRPTPTVVKPAQPLALVRHAALSQGVTQRLPGPLNLGVSPSLGSAVVHHAADPSLYLPPLSAPLNSSHVARSEANSVAGGGVGGYPHPSLTYAMLPVGSDLMPQATFYSAEQPAPEHLVGRTPLSPPAPLELPVSMPPRPEGPENGSVHRGYTTPALLDQTRLTQRTQPSPTPMSASVAGSVAASRHAVPSTAPPNQIALPPVMRGVADHSESQLAQPGGAAEVAALALRQAIELKSALGYGASRT